MLPSNICTTLSQRALTTFQSDIISPSSSVCFALHCIHWFHTNALHLCCLTPAFLSFPGLPALLYKSKFTLHSFTYCWWLFVLIETPVALAQGVVPVISLCARVWVNKDILLCLWSVCMVFDKFRPVTQSFFNFLNRFMFMCPYFLFHYLTITWNQQLYSQNTGHPLLFSSQRESKNEKITQIVSPLPSPAAETLRSDWEHCAHMSHALLTAVGDGEMGWWGIRDGGVEQWKWWNNFTAVAAVEKTITCIYSAAVVHSCCSSTPPIVYFTVNNRLSGLSNSLVADHVALMYKSGTFATTF